MGRLLAISADYVIDGTGHLPIEDTVVLIEDDRITNVGSKSEISIPDSAERIDLPGRTLLPGFVDAHSHITINPGLRGIIGQLDGLNEPPARQVLRGARNLRLDLASGVTTMRIVGEVPYNDIIVRDAIRDGFIAGPRLLVSGRAITSSNGHGSLVPAWVVDGVENMRRVVREQLRMGCDFTKLIVTGRQYTKNANEYLGFTEAEIAAAIEETHRVGRKIGAHVRSDLDTGLRVCLENGLDLTDHTFPINEETIALYHEAGATSVPTYTVGLQTWVDWDLLQVKTIAERIAHVRALDESRLATQQFDDRAMQRRVDWIRDQAPAQFMRSVEADIPYCIGTDAMHGLFAYELEVLVSWGLAPLDAISAATHGGALALGIEGETGSIEPGKVADIIAVDGNPIDDIRALANVSFVMHRGCRHDPAALLSQARHSDASWNTVRM